MSDMKALDSFFDNGNWQSGDDGDWQYEGTIDPQQAAAELAELKSRPSYCQEDELREKNAQLRAELDEAREWLIEMVNQYCFITSKFPNEPTTYSHSFMSTPECVFEYLVNNRMAKWAKNGMDIYDLNAHPEETK